MRICVGRDADNSWGCLASLESDEAIFLLHVRVEGIALSLHNTACMAIWMAYAHGGGAT